MKRLSSATITSARNAALPSYDRTSAPTITHIGVGAFARAHLGVFADDLLAAGWPAAIRGVSLRNHRAEDQLAPQDGLYTLVEREPESAAPLRVLGAFSSIETGPANAIKAIAAPTTAVVTLTVTEKGYEITEEEPGGQRSAPAVVALGLEQRRNSGNAPIVLSLDNVVDNGEVLRDAVLEVAGRRGGGLAEWISSNVAFPSSVVDRVVPVTTAADLDEVAARIGLSDHAVVVAERYRSWVVEAADGLPPLADVGVQVVGDIEPFQRRKLWLLNGPHSALAFGGLLAGCETIAAACGHPAVASFVQRYVEDVLAIADLPDEAEPRAFANDALRRFTNPMLGDRCLRIAADSSRKLPQRLFPVVRARRARGLSTRRCSVIAAAWLAAAAGLLVQGRTLPTIDDPAVEELRRIASHRDRLDLCHAAVGADTDLTFVEEVDEMLDRLAHDGLGALL